MCGVSRRDAGLRGPGAGPPQDPSRPENKACQQYALHANMQITNSRRRLPDPTRTRDGTALTHRDGRSLDATSLYTWCRERNLGEETKGPPSGLAGCGPKNKDERLPDQVRGETGDANLVVELDADRLGLSDNGLGSTNTTRRQAPPRTPAGALLLSTIVISR